MARISCARESTSFPGSSLYLKIERGPWERGCQGARVTLFAPPWLDEFFSIIPEEVGQLSRDNFLPIRFFAHHANGGPQNSLRSGSRGSIFLVFHRFCSMNWVGIHPNGLMWRYSFLKIRVFKGDVRMCDCPKCWFFFFFLRDHRTALVSRVLGVIFLNRCFVFFCAFCFQFLHFLVACVLDFQ